MKRSGIMLLVLLAATFTAMGQNDDGDTKKKAIAEITFDTTTHDFGKIPFKGDGTYTFKFENTGNKPLILTDVRASCSCTVPVSPEKPIKPGEKGEIKVEYDTGDTRNVGKFTKYVFVHSNAKDNRVRLKITGVLKKSEQ
ncbi:MAG: DUF1573 domain-containing protein [Bacteroidales bacterium]|nr:DUF1573 domain-containing protein [Bacteroidales bacterium]